MYYLYILLCADDTLYTGVTNDLKRRVEEHNEGKIGAKYTKGRRPVRLLYSKKFKNKQLAMKEECKIKKLSRNKKFKFIETN